MSSGKILSTDGTRNVILQCTVVSLVCSVISPIPYTVIMKSTKVLNPRRFDSKPGIEIESACHDMRRR